MQLLKYSLALFASQWALVYTQQPCYWPDGSGVRPGQGYWVNCHSSQDSVCCFHEDVCLASGLCFGAIINMVCAFLLLYVRRVHARALCEIDIDLKIKVYRGGCTVKDWSNTTACPNQWCNNGKDYSDRL